MITYESNYTKAGRSPRFYKLSEYYSFVVDKGLIFDNRNNLEYEALAFPNMAFKKKSDNWMHPEEKQKLEEKKKKEKPYVLYEQEKAYKENPYAKELERKRDGTILRAYDLNVKPKSIGFIGSFVTTSQEYKMNDFVHKKYFFISQNAFRNMALKHSCLDALALHIYVDDLNYYQSFPEIVFNNAWGYIKQVPEEFILKYNGVWIFEALLNHFGRLHFQEKL